MSFVLKRRRAAVVAVLTVASVVVVGCSTLPHDTEPQVLGSFSPQQNVDPTVGPTPGQEPDLLLRDFYSASAIPASDYQAARSFLAPTVADSWHPADSLLLVDAIDIVTQPDSSQQDRRAFDVRGTVIGTLATGGAYTPENGAYEAKIVMERLDGEWRITDLPPGVVIERMELRNQYQPQTLYFYEQSRRALIADRRWIYSGQQSLDTELITLMMEGPSDYLSPATSSVLPSEAQFVGVQDGTYEFTGLSSMDQDARLDFAAELVWMLANAGIPGPYKFKADDAPLVENLEEATTDDFADSNPRVAANSVVPLYAVTGGSILRVAANAASPVKGALGGSGAVQSADVSGEGTVAAVRSKGNQSELVVGDIDGSISPVLSAGTISRPTFELEGKAAWVTVDGTDVVRVVRSAASGEPTSSKVNTSALSGINGEISVIRLSRTGAEVALIIGGRVYTGVVTRSNAGEPRIVNVHEIATEIGGTALSLDWQADGSLIVGTSASESPVWRVEQDGSAVSTMPSGNITAPVVSVAASPSTIYITDSRATLQMASSDAETVFWREVPGLQGVRSSPIVAN